MIAKLVALVALLGATAWCSRAPDWEPAIALLTSFAALVTLEVRDRKNLGKTRERKERHDNALFERFDVILPERRLLNELNGPLYNNETSSSFLRRLHEFHELAETAGATFLIAPIHEAFAEYRSNVEELHRFVLQHFFTSDPPFSPEDTRHVLYPKLKLEYETEGAAIYHQRRAELLQLLEDAAESLAAFRSTIKAELSR